MVTQSGFAHRVEKLSDIELAVLSCLVAGQHCIIESDLESQQALSEELQLIASNCFGLSVVIVQCSSVTTWEDFGDAILVNDELARHPSTSRSNGRYRRRSSAFGSEPLDLDGDRHIPNIIVAKDLNVAPRQIQIQALELIRTNRIFTHTAVHTSPKPFLLITLVSTSSVPLVKHLNDRIFISHFHDVQDGLANLEESSEWTEDDRMSASSILHKTSRRSGFLESFFSRNDIQEMTELSTKVTIHVEVYRYLHNIVTFLRFHRAVSQGISPKATQHFELLVKCLAVLHGLDFVPPPLVGLAARKVYRHRISLVAPEDERSMQYGSDLAAVKELLAGVTSDTIIDEVLETVEAPL